MNYKDDTNNQTTLPGVKHINMFPEEAFVSTRTHSFLCASVFLSHSVWQAFKPSKAVRSCKGGRCCAFCRHICKNHAYFPTQNMSGIVMNVYRWGSINDALLSVAGAKVASFWARNVDDVCGVTFRLFLRKE